MAVDYLDKNKFMDHIESAKNTLDLYAKAISNVGNRLGDEFTKAVDLILNCKGRLVVAGIGKSGLVGKKMVATFASTGTPSFFLHPTEAFHGDLGMLKPADVVILISNSGETDDVNKLIPSLKAFGNAIIAFTSQPNSTLGVNADLILDITVDREACPNNLAPTTSSMVTMALGDALAVCLIEARNFKAADFARFHPGGKLGRKLLWRVKDVMATNIPTASPDTSFMECLAVMNEGRKGLVVIMEKGKLKGIITDGDVRRVLAKFGISGMEKTAAEIMTKEPKTIADNTFLAQAEEVLKANRVHCLIALDKNNQVSGLLEFLS